MSETGKSEISIFVAAGEHSGDALAAELVSALRDASPKSLKFFGAAGPQMQQAGVEPIVDLTLESVVGLWEAVQKAVKFKYLMDRLRDEIIFRKPDLIIVVDNSGFNLRLLESVQDHVRLHEQPHGTWKPKVVYFISPQVWASRAGRSKSLEENVDLLLSVFPFEKEWYHKNAPKLRVEFIGHPIADRFAGLESTSNAGSKRAQVLLLPGSRKGELERHLPVIVEAVNRIRKAHEATFEVVLPNDELRGFAIQLLPPDSSISVTVGRLADSLAGADLAIASSGTVPMECAWFGVPTIVLYKTSTITYEIARRLVTVEWIAMPNILAKRELFPEFIQQEATAENLAGAAIDWLSAPATLADIRTELKKLRTQLGTPGACRRAADLILPMISKMSYVEEGGTQ